MAQAPPKPGPQTVLPPEQRMKLNDRGRQIGDGALLVNPGHMDVFLGLQRKGLFAEPGIDELPEQIVERGEQRNPQEHPPKSHQVVKQQQGKQDPERGKPCGIPQNLGTNDIAIHLL